MLLSQFADGPGLRTPIPMSGLQLWLRGGTGITQVAGLVSSWADQSGNGNNATQATGGSQPAYDATGINSVPGVTFATGKSLFSTTNALLFNTPKTVMTVQISPTGVGGSVFMTGRASNQFLYDLSQSAGTRYYVVDSGGNAINITSAAVTTALEAEWFVTGTGTDTMDYYEKALIKATGTSVTYSSPSQPGYTVGQREGAAQEYIGTICEVLAWNRVLSGADLLQARQYLQGKYAIALGV